MWFRAIDYIDSETEEGETTTFHLPTRPWTGWRRDYRADAGAIDEVVEVEVEMLDEESHEYTVGASFEVTNRTHVKASGGIDGIASAEAENETTATAKTEFGMRGGTRQLTRSRFKATTRVQVPKGEHHIATVDMGPVREVTPYTEIGFIDAVMDLDLHNWAGNHAPYLPSGDHHNIVHCDTWQDLLWFLEGERVAEYPGMRHFLQSCSRASLDAYHWLADKENRKVELAGRRVREYDASADIWVRPA